MKQTVTVACKPPVRAAVSRTFRGRAGRHGTPMVNYYTIVYGVKPKGPVLLCAEKAMLIE